MTISISTRDGRQPLGIRNPEQIPVLKITTENEEHTIDLHELADALAPILKVMLDD